MLRLFARGLEAIRTIPAYQIDHTFEATTNKVVSGSSVATVLAR